MIKGLPDYNFSQGAIGKAERARMKVERPGQRAKRRGPGSLRVEIDGRAGSDPEALFELANAVARDAQFAAAVLQPDQHAVHARINLLHRRDVDDRRPMNPHELAPI